MRSDPLKLGELIEPTLARMGYELWGCEYHGRGRRALVRVYIDKPDGVTLDDCKRVSHQLSGLLDVEDPVRGSYTLEVSSPGLDRPLLRPEHFERCAGQEVRVRLTQPVDGRRNFTGELKGLDAGQVLVEQDGIIHALPLDVIERARLAPEF